MTIFSPVPELIEEAAHGRMVVLVDDENRENEGDLFIPAACVTPDIVNFMAMHGRGLICMPMEGALADRLHLPLMVRDNQSRHSTAFTVSIGAREGMTTGISSHDRAHTILTAVAPDSQPSDLVRPGHVFPLRARDGGVLARPGHTEASVDIARMAGFPPAGVICEIMRDDGAMARLSDLTDFVKKHELKIGSIADIIAYMTHRMEAAE